LDLIPKASSKDDGTQAYLYTRQPGNLSDVGLTTNYEQLQNQLQQYVWYYSKLVKIAVVYYDFGKSNFILKMHKTSLLNPTKFVYYGTVISVNLTLF